MNVEPATFEQLASDLRPRVLRYLSRFVGATEAEDLAQEVFLKVHKGMSSFRGEATWSTWVFQVATHAAMDRLKSASHRASRAAFPETVLDQDASRAHPSHEGQPAKEEMCRCIRNHVDELPLTDRTILRLCDLEELQLEEVARVLEITQGSVKIRLHRARKRLRGLLEQDCRILLDQDAELHCDLRGRD